MNSKATFAIAFAAIAAAASAQAELVMNRAGGNHWHYARQQAFWGAPAVSIRFRHVPNSDPNDPFHDTYRKNLGKRAAQTRSNDSEAKRKTDELDRKIARLEGEIAALERQGAKEAERKSPISVYSNLGTTAASSSHTTYNICNSSVVINN